MLSKSSFVMSFVQPLDNTWSAGVKDDVVFSGGGNPPEEGRALLFALGAGVLLIPVRGLMAYKTPCS